MYHKTVFHLAKEELGISSNAIHMIIYIRSTLYDDSNKIARSMNVHMYRINLAML